MQVKIFRALALVAALAVPQAAAASVVFDESVDGDAQLGAPPVVALLLGVNEIRGSVTFSFPDFPRVDFDRFRLLVAPRSQITSIRISMALQDMGAGELNAVAWAIGMPDDLMFLGEQPVPIPSSGVSALATALPIGPGTYDLQTSAIIGNLSLGQGRTADYSIQIAVAPIPLPAGLALLAGALGLLTLVGWRRRTA